MRWRYPYQKQSCWRPTHLSPFATVFISLKTKAWPSGAACRLGANTSTPITFSPKYKISVSATLLLAFSPCCSNPHSKVRATFFQAQCLHRILFRLVKHLYFFKDLNKWSMPGMYSIGWCQAPFSFRLTGQNRQTLFQPVAGNVNIYPVDLIHTNRTKGRQAEVFYGFKSGWKEVGWEGGWLKKESKLSNSQKHA